MEQKILYRLYQWSKSQQKWRSTNHVSGKPDYNWGDYIGAQIAKGTAAIVKETISFELPKNPR